MALLLSPAEKPGWEEEDGAQEREQCAEGDADEPQRER